MNNVVSIHNTNTSLRFISLDLIQEEVVMLRSEYDQEALDELGDSLDENGTLQPIVVALANNEKYELIIGSRRLRSTRQKGHTEILAIVIEPQSPLNYLLMALSENLQREDLNVFEEARAFLRLMKDYDLGIQEVAKNVHKSESYVRRRMMLLSLPEEVQTLVANKSLPLYAIEEITSLPDGESQVHYAYKTVSERLSAVELRELIRQESEKEFQPTRSSDRGLSIQKVRVRMDIFSRWIRKLSGNKNFSRNINSQERSVMLKSLDQLEAELRTIRSVVTGYQRVQPKHSAPPKPSGGDLKDPDNHRDEWSLRHLNQITAPDRPSDDELSRKLGRSVPAIRAMRSQMQRKKKT